MNPCKIILTEDDFIIQLFLQKVLNNFDCEIVGKYDNANATLLALENEDMEVDLALLDISLSGKMNGVELAKQIKKSYNIPIVFVTGSTDSATYNEALKVDPIKIISKPIEEVDLHQELTEIMNILNEDNED